MIAPLWDEILQRGPQARSQSFHDLKVGVLRIERLLRAIAERTSVDLPITVAYQAPTLHALAELVRKGAAPPTPQLALIARGEGAPPLSVSRRRRHGAGVV